MLRKVEALESRLVSALEAAARLRPGARAVEQILKSLGRRDFRDPANLIRFHEVLLFLAAYPHGPGVLRRARELLESFAARVGKLALAGADLAPFDTPEVSGIAGTTVTSDFSYDLVRWLKARYARHVRIDWAGFEATDRLRALLPSFLPLLEEEALEDANVPYRLWLREGQAKPVDDLAWLLARLHELPVAEADRAERYEALGLSVSFELGSIAASRTRMRRPARRIFFHDAPLLSRQEVSLEAELSGRPMDVRKLSRLEGRTLLDMAREAKTVRYREYYGFTYGDPGSVWRGDAGRGVQIFLCGLDRGRRLPLRAGFAAFIVKNGVPVGYVEALAFLERVEVGFNIYYTYREGESVWIFAKVLKILHQVLGVESFSIDPYQIGHQNEEAIASGAFWFYRKLGFRPTDRKILALVEREERRISAAPGYRTPAKTLRQIATGNLLYGFPPSRKSEWDRFHVRNLGLAVQRRMVQKFAGDAQKIRRSSVSRTASRLGCRLELWSGAERRSFENWALILDLLDDLSRWARPQKLAVAEIVRAKSGRDERRFLRLMQGHDRLRRALVQLGSDFRPQAFASRTAAERF